jgi:pimeloyl-ACP methyl ester carboxylesterase
MERGVSGDTAFICGRWPLDSSRATLVFIHGAGGSSLLWQAQVQGLKARVNTVAVDLPGHGRSGGGARQTVPEYASALVDFITSIQAPSPIPCGLSMGGAISQQLLLDHSGHFQAGIIVSSGARLRVLPSLLDLILSDMHAYVGLIDRMGFCQKTPVAVKQAFLEDALRADPAIAHGDFKACDRFDVMPRLGAIQVPVLIISAENDRLTPPAYGLFLEKNIPGAVRRHILDAGHFVPIEKPIEVNAAITGFLDAQGL